MDAALSLSQHYCDSGQAVRSYFFKYNFCPNTHTFNIPNWLLNPTVPQQICTTAQQSKGC